MTLEESVVNYIAYLRQQNYSQRTIESYVTALNHFRSYFKEIQLNEITSRDLLDFQRDLYRNSTMGTKSQSRILTVIRMLFKHSMRYDYIRSDPSTCIELPRVSKNLPKNLVSIEQIQKMMEATEQNTHLALRNRVIIELFYATGMRVTELINLNIHSIKRSNRQIHILGKGNKERIIPLSNRAISITEKYIIELRPNLLRYTPSPQIDSGILILSWRGKKMARTDISVIIKTAAIYSQIPFKVTPHSIRHSLATHLLKAGMGIRYIQELLGHEDLRTTQIYTQVQNTDLIEMIERYHPLSI